MLRSLFTTALRRLFRHRGFALTNIAGLVVGLAAAFLLGLFVEHELSYDEFHDDVGDIYRVIEHPPDGGSPVVLTRMPVLPALEQEMPEIAAGTRMRNYDRAWLGGPEGQMEIAPLYVDSTFFDVFSFEVLRGNAREAVSTPGAIALTASVAETLFGNANPVGETLPVNFGSSSYRVAAVVADPPANSSIDFEALASRQNVPGEALETIGSWYNTNTPTYVRLEDGADRAALEEKLPAFSERRLRAHPDGKSTLGLRPLKQEHAAATNSRQLIGLLSALAIAILLIAGINTTNLTTARGLGRVGELGMRQALGARRPGLVLQFFLESLVTCAVAAGLALLVVVAVLPSFNNLLNLSLSIDGPRHLPAAAAITLLLGIAIGAYPALYLTRGSIANALRGRFEHSRSGQRLRSGLVVAQFALSAVLVVGSVGVWQQVQHMKAVDPGVDEDRVVVADVTTEPFNSSETADARLRAMRDRLLQSPEVEAVSFSGVVPTNYKGNFNTYQVSGSSGSDIRFRQVTVDQHYFDTYGVELSAGRPFRPVTTGKTWLTDRGAIVNATGAEAIRARTGDSTVVGTTLTPGGASFKLEVRAVTRSFRFGSAETNTTPVVHFYSGDHPSHYDYMSVRLAPGTTQAGMDRLRTEWDRVYPAVPLDYFFVDDAFDQLYRTQERIGTLAGIAAALAVFLACLGLLGLAAFAIRQRLREISIRKVLGASAESIVLLLSKDFLKLVGLALAAGLPAAYFLLDWWLADFAVRIDLSLRLFVLSGAGMVALAFLTVGLRAARAALLEPAPVLQSGE